MLRSNDWTLSDCMILSQYHRLSLKYNDLCKVSDSTLFNLINGWSGLHLIKECASDQVDIISAMLMDIIEQIAQRFHPTGWRDECLVLDL